MTNAVNLQISLPEGLFISTLFEQELIRGKDLFEGGLQIYSAHTT